MEDAYRAALWNAWKGISRPVLEEIPVSKAELYARIGSSSYFDGGETTKWMKGLGEDATWRAVRDAVTGHTIHVVSDRSFAELTSELVFGLRILRWMSGTGRPIVWYWWDQPWERVMPANTLPSRLHINGGFATPGVREVHVYRREEAHKVMIHEAIHALELDRLPHKQIDAVRGKISADIGHKLWPHLGEALTELLAEWYWTIVGGAQTLNEVRARWENQVICSERQAAQIWVRVRDVNVVEDTNVFAYYILKWVLMQHLDEALFSDEHGLRLWFKWWQEARGTLEHRASLVLYTEGKPMSMGMTCEAEGT